MQTRVVSIEPNEHIDEIALELSGIDDAPQQGDGPAVVAVGVSRDELRALAAPAARLARARGARLVLLYVGDGRSGRRRWGVSLWLRSLAGEHEAETWTTCPSRSRSIALRRAIDSLNPQLLVLPAESEPLRELADSPPVETVLVHGAAMGTRSRRILALLEGTPARDRLILSSAEGMLEEDETERELVLVRVVPSQTTPAECEALRVRTEQSLPLSTSGVRRTVRVVRAQSRESAVLGALRRDPFDLLVMWLPHDGVTPWTGRAVIPRLLARSPVPVLLASRPVPGLGRRVGAVVSALYGLLPSLPESERVRTYSSLRRSARGGPDFTFMIVLATAIAGLGLCLDSGTVVIGAMLVAPLMTPIMGVGMGVAEGDGRLVRIAAQSVMRGTVTVLAVALVIGLTLPPNSLTGEMLARTRPASLDVVVALITGAAGAYALCRKGAASALPGVAIAVSLVPPLTTAGIAAATRQEQAAAGASLLFLLNLTAVSFASSVVFLWIGFRPHVSRVGRIRLFARGLGGLVLLLVAVSLPVAWLNWRAGSGPNLEEDVGAALTSAVAALDDVEVRDYEVSATNDGKLLVWAEIAASELRREEARQLQESVAESTGKPVELSLDLIRTTHVPSE